MFLKRSVTISSLNKHGQVTHTQSTEIKSLLLERNAEKLLMEFDENLHYPMVVSVKMYVASIQSDTVLSNLPSTITDE